MQPEIKTLKEKRLVGKRKRMSFAGNKTGELWQSFMPVKKQLQDTIGTELYSVEIYDDPSFFQSYSPEKEFEKWAAIEVSSISNIPDDMEVLTIPAGLYAVFVHKGPASEGPETYRYIFETWLPNSGFVLDDRPHFAVMGEKYKQDAPDSEEELWVPVKSE